MHPFRNFFTLNLEKYTPKFYRHFRNKFYQTFQRVSFAFIAENKFLPIFFYEILSSHEWQNFTKHSRDLFFATNVINTFSSTRFFHNNKPHHYDFFRRNFFFAWQATILYLIVDEMFPKGNGFKSRAYRNHENNNTNLMITNGWWAWNIYLLRM